MAASILKKAGKYLQNLGESVLSKQLEKQEGVADKNDEFVKPLRSMGFAMVGRSL